MSDSKLPSLPPCNRKEFLGETTRRALPSTAAQADSAVETLSLQLLRAISTNDRTSVRVVLRQLVFVGADVETAVSPQQWLDALLTTDTGDAAKELRKQLAALASKQWPLSIESSCTLLQGAAASDYRSLFGVLLDLPIAPAILRLSGWDVLNSAALAGNTRIMSDLFDVEGVGIPVKLRDNLILRNAIEAQRTGSVKLLANLILGQESASTGLFLESYSDILLGVLHRGTVDMLGALMPPCPALLHIACQRDLLLAACEHGDKAKLTLVLESLFQRVDQMYTFAHKAKELERQPSDMLGDCVDSAVVGLLRFKPPCNDRPRRWPQCYGTPPDADVCEAVGFMLDTLTALQCDTALRLACVPALLVLTAAIGGEVLWRRVVAFVMQDNVVLRPPSDTLLSRFAQRGLVLPYVNTVTLVPAVRLAAAGAVKLFGAAEFDPSHYIDMLATKFRTPYKDWPYAGARLVAACHAGNVREIERLLEQYDAESLHAKDDLAFRTACERNFIAIVDMFLTGTKSGRFEPAEYNNGALVAACAAGSYSAVHLLLERNSAHAFGKPTSSKSGHKQLDLTTERCIAYRVACYSGRVEAVKKLDEAFRQLEGLNARTAASNGQAHPFMDGRSGIERHFSKQVGTSYQASELNFESLILAAAVGSAETIAYLITSATSSTAPPIDLYELSKRASGLGANVLLQATAVTAKLGHADALRVFLQHAGQLLSAEQLAQLVHVAVAHDQTDTLGALLEYVAAATDDILPSFGDLLLVAAEHGSTKVVVDLCDRLRPKGELKPLQNAFAAAALVGNAASMVALLQAATPAEAKAMACCIPAAAAAIRSGNRNALLVMLTLFSLNPLLRSWCAGDGMLLALGNGDGALAKELFDFELFFKQRGMLEFAEKRRHKSRESPSPVEQSATPPVLQPEQSAVSAANGLDVSILAPVPVAHAPILERLPTELQGPLECALWKATTAKPSVSVAAEHSKSLRSGDRSPPAQNSHPLLEELDLHQVVPEEHTADSEPGDGSSPSVGSARSTSHDHGSPTHAARAGSPARDGVTVPASQLGYVFRESPQLRNMLKLATKTEPEASAKLAAAARAFVGEGGWERCPPGRRVLLYPVMVAACCVSKQSMGSFFIELFRPAYLKSDGASAVPYAEWPLDLQPLAAAYMAAAVAAAGAGNRLQLQQMLEELVWLHVPEQTIKLAVTTSVCSALNAGHWFLLRELLFPTNGFETIDMTPNVQQYAMWAAHMLMGSESWDLAQHLPEHLVLKKSVDGLFHSKPLRCMPGAMPTWMRQVADEAMREWGGKPRMQRAWEDDEFDFDESERAVPRTKATAPTHSMRIRLLLFRYAPLYQGEVRR